MKRRILILLVVVALGLTYSIFGALTEQMNEKNDFTFLKLR